MNISYVLPIKWDGDQPLDELTDYLKYLSVHVDLVIVDGSLPICFVKHHRFWADLGTHIPPYPRYLFLNGKVNGVLTGLSEAKHDHVILADDDVRYTLEQIKEIDELLSDNQLVSPQNYFDPCPWHALWDTSRSLLNLAFAHDYPGTIGLQRDFILSLGGYDGDVLFENLELMRTVRAGEGKICHKDDLFIRRIPPSTAHFWSQRIRQAYDDHAQPARLWFFIMLLPVSFAVATYSIWFIVIEVTIAVAAAEVGRQRSGGTRVFPAVCSLFAPIWLLERGICTWLALLHKLINGGVTYNQSIISNAANPIQTIRERWKK